MNPIKIAAVSVNQTPMDWEGNLARLKTAITEAWEGGAQFIVTPEMSVTGYGCEDFHNSPDLQATAWEQVLELCQERACDYAVVLVGFPLRYRNVDFNAVAVIYHQEVKGIVCKQNLANDGVHYEDRWFHPWEPGVRDVWTSPEGRPIPIGDLLFNAGGIRFGIEICEDAWVAHRPGPSMSQRGADFIFNPSASHFAFGKAATREDFVREGSRACNCTYVYANLVGNESGRTIFDGGNIIASLGTVLSRGNRFFYPDHDITTAVVDVDHTRTKQAWTASVKPQIGPDPLELKITDCVPPPHREVEGRRSKYEPPTQPCTTPFDTDKVSEFEQAEALGLWDYMRKSYSRGFVISASGGADSSACIELANDALTRATFALGPKGVVKRVPYMTELREYVETASPGVPAFLAMFMKKMLHCAYQGSDNSSETTLNAARALTESVGGTFYDWSISSLVAGYTEIAQTAIGRELTWERDDITLQNIQARVRAPSIWMLANITGGVLLVTSNRSEGAVGYTTMDGDTSGGLAPLAGIDKAFLRYWLRTREDRSTERKEALHLVNAQQPTAELRPGEEGQTDEDDLMPFPVLDAIEKSAIRDKRMPCGTYEVMLLAFPEVDSEDLYRYVKLFYQLWARNQWKRERFACSFHLDDENLDPKSWCRFPVLSAGFRHELDRLYNTYQPTALGIRGMG